MLFPQSVHSDQPLTYMALGPVTPGADIPDIRGLYAGPDLDGLEQSPVWASTHSPLLLEHAQNTYLHPGLTGHRITQGPEGFQAGRSWSPRFLVEGRPEQTADSLIIKARDEGAQLGLKTRVEAMAGGSLRIRHTLRNLGADPFLLEGLEIRLPLDDQQTQILDFAGRHERERSPQRHDMADGAWVREFRWGRTGFEGPVIMVGTPGFNFHHGRVLCVQPAWSGNTVLRVDRNSATPAGVSAGELLLPGEVVLDQGQEYSTPWIVVTASDHGMDPIMNSLHAWERTLTEHPREQPVILNVWEAIAFNHDFNTLRDLADRAARIGVERLVLDDGWFHLRRDDKAGLGDWWVDPAVWPQGLEPLVDYVHKLGMQFGLWFEPEMINPDSDAFRDHPEWVMRASSRNPELQRNQLVLDLTNPQAFNHVLEAMTEVLGSCQIDYVKWDHNRDLLEAGSQAHGGAPAIHEQTLAYYHLLDALRARFPKVEWESCASGGGRIDLGVIEKIRRFWNSDMTDALSRQLIQRWTEQTVAPEYIGAHISQPSSQQTGRTYSLDFRAATAVFGSMGIEWDIRQASEEDLERLKEWITWYKVNRGFLHSGRVVRLDLADPSALAHGVVAPDRSRAILAHVQLDESLHNRGVCLRIPGLDPKALYRLAWTGPAKPKASLEHLDPTGPLGTAEVTGTYLERVGIRIPRCQPETIRLIDLVRV